MTHKTSTEGTDRAPGHQPPSDNAKRTSAAQRARRTEPTPLSITGLYQNTKRVFSSFRLQGPGEWWSSFANAGGKSRIQSR